MSQAKRKYGGSIFLRSLFFMLMSTTVRSALCLQAQKNEQTAPMAAEAHPTFEVVTIKPSDPNASKGNFRIGAQRIYVDNQTVENLISIAFGVHHGQIVDGPNWMTSQKYDIVGDADITGAPSFRQVQEMLQKLLQNRFGLKFHREGRDLPIYAIVVTNGGPKLKKNTSSADSNPLQTGGKGQDGNQVRIFTNNSMSDFALGMQAYLDRPVVDQTGLSGRYDFVLEWSHDLSQTPDTNAGPGIFTAVQEQLGLKLRATKGTVDTLAIDHIQQPSEN